ncbi:MAG: LysR family transcriptional regulator [Elusimicrobia bacterium]|nr:LysR family transcriptional regulator [Elusimicrobiota bacterium]
MRTELNYHHLYYFWTCVRAGSVTSAARELNLSQSALSLQIKSLENSLGRRLLERSRTGVEMTDDGRMVFEHCERIFPEGQALSAALRVGRESRSTPVRLGVSSSLGRPVVLAALSRLERVRGAAPSVFVGPRDDVAERLARRRVDLALVGDDLTQSLGAGYRARRLDVLRLLFVAAPELSRRLAPFPRRRSEVPMLLRARAHPVRDSVEAWLHARGVRACAVAETEDADLLRHLARRGRGVAALHEPSVRPDLEAGRLVKIGEAPRGLSLEVWAAAPTRPPADAVVRAAVDDLLRGGPLFPRSSAKP